MDPEIAVEAEKQRKMQRKQGSPEAPSCDAPLDLVHLARYTLGDQSLEQEILGLFADQLPKTMARLKAAKSAKDWLSAAHTLKGSARAVGAWRLAECASLAEKIDFAGDQDAQEEALKGLDAATSEARAFVSKLAAA